MEAPARAPSSEVHEIVLRLQHPDELFVLPTADLFSEYRNWLTGMEIAISELKGQWRRRPVRLRVQLPEHEITRDLAPKMQRAVTSFCTRRRRYNGNEIRSIHRDGWGALVIGLLILIVSLIGQQVVRDHFTATWSIVFFADGLFMVTAWIGMWYPLDQLVYYARPYRLETKALEQLASAEVVVEPARPRAQ